MARKKEAEGEEFLIERTRMDLRLDPELHGLLKEAAQKVGVSVNQLVQGILWANVRKMIPGDCRIEYGAVHQSPFPGRAFFGELTSFEQVIPPEDWEDFWSSYLNEITRERFVRVGNIPHMGQVWYQLDFTERGAVRDVKLQFDVPPDEERR